MAGGKYVPPSQRGGSAQQSSSFSGGNQSNGRGGGRGSGDSNGRGGGYNNNNNNNNSNNNSSDFGRNNNSGGGNDRFGNQEQPNQGNQGGAQQSYGDGGADRGFQGGPGPSNNNPGNAGSQPEPAYTEPAPAPAPEPTPEPAPVAKKEPFRGPPRTQTGAPQNAKPIEKVADSWDDPDQFQATDDAWGNPNKFADEKASTFDSGAGGGNKYKGHSVDEKVIEGMFEHGQGQGINFDKYDNIPVEVSGEGANQISPINTFDTTGFHELLLKNITRARYSKPTPVQKYSVPIGLCRRDLMACAQTGSGKTAGFLFPMINRLLYDGTPPSPHSQRAYPSVLILAPTRELAIQIYDESMKFCFGTFLKAVVVYGGADIKEQFRQLNKGCSILVATPGRLGDIIERGKMGLCNCQFLVLDEADRMLDMGFEPKIREIITQHDLPQTGDRQTMMFSATFPKEIQKLAGEFLSDYLFLTVGRVGSTTDSITQNFEWVQESDKRATLLGMLTHIQKANPNSTKHLILVFVETKREADTLNHFLGTKDLKCTCIHGDREQYEREEALRSFRAGRTPVLVATDVAARGLDIPNVAHVIQYDLPNSIDDYVHRIGRTGRAGNTGTATAFVNDKNRGIAAELTDLLRDANQEVPHFLAMRGPARGGRGGGGRGKKFGGTDVRNEGEKYSDNGMNARGHQGGGGGDWGNQSNPQADRQKMLQMQFGNRGGRF